MGNAFIQLLEFFNVCAAFIEQRIAGHWILNLILLAYAIASSVISNKVTSDRIHAMEKPLSKSTVWLCWLCAGFWGGTWFCLTPNLENPSRKKIWLVFTWVFFLFILLTLTFHMFDLQYKIATLLILLLVCINILLPIGWISYLTDKFNAEYYLKHIETDLILAGKELPADWTIKMLTTQMKNLNEYIEIVHKIAEDETIGTEDAERSFLKNLLTAGRYNQLQREIGRLNTLAEASEEIQEEMITNDILQSSLERFLMQYRVAAYRNISFCKGLLGLLKTVEGTKQDIVHDVSIPIPQSAILSTCDTSSFSRIEFDSEAFTEGVMSSVDVASKSLTAIQNSGNKIQKADFAEAAITIGISAITEGISGIIDLNEQTTNQRALVLEEISRITADLERLLPKLNTYRAQILRQVELLTSLKELNSAFVKVYEPLRQSIYNDRGGYAKDFEVFLSSPETKKQLGLLTAICSTYSKINQAK